MIGIIYMFKRFYNKIQDKKVYIHIFKLKEEHFLGTSYQTISKNQDTILFPEVSYVIKHYIQI